MLRMFESNDCSRPDQRHLRTRPIIVITDKTISSSSSLNIIHYLCVNLPDIATSNIYFLLFIINTINQHKHTRRVVKGEKGVLCPSMYIVVCNYKDANFAEF